MKILKYFSISIMFSLLFSACETSQTPVDHLSALLQRIDNESDGYTEEDWNNITAEFTEIEEELSKYEYSDEELREIGRLKGKIIAKMAKSTVNDLKKQTLDLSKQLEGGLEGFMEEINNEENN